MALKTYILLPHTEASANVYRQVNGNQRIRLYKRPYDHAYGQITFTDRDGKNKTIRLKLGVDEIDQTKQIKELFIPANEKYTQAERDALMFVDGVLMTENETVQKFLETSPQYDKNWDPKLDPEFIAGKVKQGRIIKSADIRQPLYTLYDESIELDAEDALFMKRLKAANKIAAITDLVKAQELMYRLNGSFFEAPDDIKKCRQQLVRFLDEADDAMLNELLKDDVNKDEEVEILLGKCIRYGFISFDQEKDQVSKVIGDKVTKLKMISSEYDHEERKRYFIEFLTSNDGKLLMDDLKKLVAKEEKAVPA